MGFRLKPPHQTDLERNHSLLHALSMALLPRKKSQARLWASVNQQGSVSPSAVMLIYTWYALVLYLLTQSTNDHSAPSQALAMLTHPLHL